ncbi:MAG: TolC family outer membrane protein [Parasphingorhabdus sp.]|nr:TolC family outer membrane protein [Parasphingorhabdus sp.]
MRKFASILLASAAVIVAAVPACAETLRDALVAAYTSNPTLTGARAQQRAIDEGVPLAKANGRPNVSGQFTYQENFLRSANSFTSPERQGVAAGSVSVPIYSGGAVKNAVTAAKTRVAAGQLDLRATESSLFANVVAAYMDVITNSALVELNRANVGVLTVNLQSTRDRFEIGDLTRTDVAQSDSRLQIAKSDLETARANLIRAKENYIALVGSPPADLAPPPPLPNLPGSPDDAVDVALVTNPDLLAAKQRSAAAAIDIRAAEASRKPQVSVVSQGSYVNFFNSLGGNIPGGNFVQEQSTAQIGVQANVPIYQGGGPSAQVRQAQARSGVANEQQIAVERDVIAQTRAAYSSWRASQEVILSSQAAVDASTLSLEGVRAENSVGNRTILDILNAEQELLNSQVQLVVARRNAYVAGFSLLAAMGRAEARDLGLEGGVLYDPQVNYDRVRGQINDYQTDPDPVPQASRTVDTPAQKADIPALPNVTKAK